MKRRRFVQGAIVTGSGLGLGLAWSRWAPAPEPWRRAAITKRRNSRVLIARCAQYEPIETERVVRDGLLACGVAVLGKRVVLKPNFVEYDPRGVVNTHPVLVAATAQALRRLGAREVVVAEGPGHRRDNGYLLKASGLLETLRDIGVAYVDLNRDQVRSLAAGASYTKLQRLWLPQTIVDADLVISMPKLKTHHWAGVTLSMKNLFGIMPGAVYGWPKNVLHWHGIERSILDISATLAQPPFTIVDGIVGMEGNGPIQGSSVPAGVLVFGADPVAVDATATRMMQLEPERIAYLEEAGRFRGNMHLETIVQIGEAITQVQRAFVAPPRMEHLRAP